MKKKKAKTTDDRFINHSQNFTRESIVDELLALPGVSINSTDLVIEIGPGKGSITRALSRMTKDVIAVEKDENLAIKLRQDFLDSNVSIVFGDIMHYDLPSISYKVVANIPFNMTADIIRKLTEAKRQPEAMYLIMQYDAVGRFAGLPIERETQTSILLKPWFSVSILKRIDRRSFVPMPQVDAAFVLFGKRTKPLIEKGFWQAYRDFVIYGYNQGESTILKAYKEIFTYSQAKVLDKQLSLNNLKPSELTIEQWIGLFNAYMNPSLVNHEKRELVLGEEERHHKKHLGRTSIYRTRRPNNKY